MSQVRVHYIGEHQPLYRLTVETRLVALWATALAAAWLLLFAPLAHAARTTFDHNTTGYELIGEHRSAACDGCHVGGIFKGTPKDCFTCHAAGSRFGASAKPTTHMVSDNNCAECHTPFNWQPTAMFNHTNVLGTCNSCHNGVQASGKPAGHVPTTAECSLCHIVTLPWSEETFAHTGITDNCASCHDNVHAPGKPPTHMPSTAPCEACHSPTNFKTFANTSMNHAGITNNCQACHETGMSWYGVTMVDRPTPAQDALHPTATSPGGADCANCHSGFNVGDFNKDRLPSNHIPLAPGSRCMSCHTGADFSVMPSLTNIHAYAPSTSTNCAQCHGPTTAPTFAIPAAKFSIVTMPANHVPTTAACESCHVGAGSSIAATPVVNGAKFAKSAMGHAGLTTCAGCHGPTITGASFAGITKIVVMPATSPAGPSSHIPSGTACESCHQATMPSGLVPANATKTAPGTTFQTPAPTTAMIHSGVTTGCVNCHESGYLWMDVGQYPISPSAVTGLTTTQYLGFNTRPGKTASTFGLLDSAHPTTGDCGQCHGNTNYFDAVVKPSNHIPTAASSQCTNCHTGTDFSVMPTLTNIHAYAPSTSANCTQCHGPTTAPTFAIPAANFSIVTMPANHVPTTAACESCHVGAGSSIAATPVVNGAKFTNSAMSHAGLTTCVGCHGPTITGASFAGITKIVVMPATSPAGPSSHIPSATSCESCHQATMPSGLVPANATATAPGTKFATPAPTTAMIHSGVTTGCANCHESGYLWMDVGQYPISPTALTGISTTQYTGFNTRPGKTASTFSLADAAHPTTGDCGQCHGNTNYFDAVVKPSNHIPTAASSQCTNCHTGTDFSVMPTLTNIHAYAPSTSANCTQCHGPTTAPTFAIPAANFSIVTMPANHVPTTAACESCHVGAGSSIAATPVVNGAKFTNSAMSHAGLTTCVGCHGPTITGASFTGITKIVVMPATSPAGPSSHIPSATSCESCHQATMPSGLVPANATATAPGTKFATPAPTTAMIHSGVTTGCANCHESGYLWMDAGQYPISPTALTGISTTQYTGFNTRPGKTASTFGLADAAHPTTGDCGQCHGNTNYFDAVVKPSNHIPTAASSQCTNCHTGTDFSVMPTLTNIHAYAPSTSSNCTQCHGPTTAPTFAIPAANFSIVTMPANHVPTTAACESCHVGAGSSIAATPVVNGAKFTNSAMSHAGLTTCVGCHGPTITGASFTGITKIVVMPATSPAGPSSHIPSATNCESCHQATMPSGLVPANAAATAPGTKFATPAPTTAMIHSGVTTGCANCHEGGYLWMDVGQYPISPSAVTGLTTTQYLGFNTRPGKTASTFSLADAAHPTTGDCGQCHGNTNYFDAVVKPSNHIPTAASSQCTNCHTGTDFSVMPTLTNIHAYAPSTSSNCTQCHGPTTAPTFAIPAANFSIVTMPANHVPTTAACESCHVGAGSSIAATPVVNGAKFTNSAMSHAGLTTCVGCHGPTITGASFAGVTSIVAMPASSPAGPSSHIPSATTCESCHQATMPSGLVPANATKTAPGTTFQTPAPTTAMIHSGVTTGCANCHESGYLWMDAGQYPISPTALTGISTTQYTGFNTRPGKTASTFSLADAAHPTTGDCGQCHGNTNYFDAVVKPSNHIPTAASSQCTNCHTGTDFSVMPTLTNIHAYAPSTSANCTQCHGPTTAPTFAIPAANFSIVTMPANHMPTSAACESCHVGAGSSIAATPVVNGAKFTNSAMSHAGLTTCVGCHGPTITGASFTGITKIVVMPATSPAGPSSHIPSATNCESCHQATMPSGLVPANATKTAPGTTFQTPAPTTAMIHSGVTTGCANCHESGYLWMDAGQYPISPTALTGISTTQYTGFNTRPGKTASTFSLADAAHPTTGDCGQCHGNTNYFDAVVKPSNHIPTAASSQCTNCHTGTDFSVMPTLTNIHAYAPSTSANCTQCHGPTTAPTFAIPAANFSIVTMPANHVPTTAACESCHVGAGSSMASTPVVNGAKFTNSAMSHAGLTTCAGCHGPTITGASFTGITKIVVMPATSPAGPSSHIPSGTACESCHQATMPSGLVPANATKTSPGTTFQTPAPTTAMIHSGVTTGCANCHESGYLWMDVGQYPISPSAVTGLTTTQYLGFNTRPGKTASTFGLLDSAHPTTGDCGQCHGNTNYFDAVVKPSNHIPTAASSQCTNCHTGTDFSVMPTLTNIHAYAPSTSANCTQCHGPTTAPTFAIPAANFSIVTMPANHVPTTAACESCHVGAGSSMASTPVVNGAKFTNSAMSHAGLTTCVGCHGPTITGASFAGITKIVVMPATSPMGANSHIPSGTACESCHQATMPSGLVPANATATAPGTKFATPVPTTAMIHSGVTTGCANCHESGYLWMDASRYPISPTALTGISTTQYTGFNTRPGKTASTFGLADAAHPTTGDCGQCHGNTNYFDAVVKPSNHIPTAASSQCTNCHTGTDFSVMPTLTNIHAYAPSTSSNCTQCHGPTTAPTFAIPAANFSIVTMPANHVPTTAACESCHVGAGSSMASTPVVNGAKFTNSAMSHAGLTTCVGCHGPTITGASFTGITKIVVMPATSPAGPSSHIPSATNCESCHQATMPSGLVPANAAATAPGTKFATPVPTTAMIHSGVTTGCVNCHESGYLWMDASRYPISPNALTGLATTQYTGFNTRPGKTASTFGLLDNAHPTTGDCGQCHSNTNYFQGVLKPSNHIPTAASAQCTNCHTGTDFSVMPTLTNIHAYAPSTSSNCTQCHGPTTAPTFAIPAANFSIVTMPANHVPTTAACESCHVGAGSSMASTPVVNGAKFTNSAMSHAGLTTCVGCHGPTITGASFTGITKIVVMPATSPVGATSHIPSGTACETCHAGTMPSGLIAANATKTAPGTAFLAPAPTTAMIHSGVTTGCVNCHESGYLWMDASRYPISPTALTGISTTQYTGFNTRPGKTASTFGLADAAHPTTGDCGQCHGNTNYFEGVQKPSNHIPTAASAQCTNCHTGTDFSVMPTLTNIHAYAPSTSSNCTQCHGPTTAPTFAIPAANFSIVTMPANHVPTTAACESCHVGAGSSIAATPVVNGAKFTNSAMSHAGLTTCVGCHGPTITGASFAGITKIVVMPATSPVGATSHIPSGTACESCHQATMPSGLVPANATVTAPGTKFATPVPTTAMIHSGVTTGCVNCHESGYLWMDASRYPISPTALTGLATTQYTGFNTRPGKTASTFGLLDNAHPTTGDCGQCHSNTNYFQGVLKPSNHIPTAASAQCTNCHIGTDFSVMPTLTSIHAYAPSTKSNCTQCHGPTTAPTFAIPAANFSIVTMPANHVPTTAACESCHVGAGSSIAATPVVNGAKFTNSAMSHAGLTTCAECHGQGIHGSTFAGITSIVVMPATAPMGPSAHILSTSNCEGCHMATVPSGLVPANSTKTPPGTKFQSPAPTTAMIHSGVTKGCATCHEGAYQWLDMTANYPLNPGTLTGISTTQYMGFQTRPGKTASSTNILDSAHPTSGDCSQCHTRTDYFQGVLKPSNHIPTAASAQCTNCHTGTDFSVMPTLTSIHAYAPSTSSNCTQCHGPTTAPTFAIPAANFSIVTMPANHVPTTAACESCHVGAGSSIAATPVVNGAKFTNSAMNHAGLTTCVGCHGPTITGASFVGITKIVVMPATSPMGANAHIPSGTACESCHQATMPAGLVPANATVTAPGTKFATPAPTTAMIHSGITSGCAGCHESGYQWMDASKYPISPTALTGVSSTHYTGFNTRPGKTASTFGLADSAHPTTGDCSQCHGNTSYFDGTVQPSNHIPTAASAQCTNCHTGTDFSVMPTLTNIHAHAPSTSSNCTQCHGPTTAPTFAIPAANFSIVTMPANHVPTTAACESCHVGAGSSIASTPVVNGAKFTNSAMSHAGLTTCVACHGPTITGASFAGITKIVVMPPTSPVGGTSHIPSATACEACHSGSMPSGLVPANAAATAPGTKFATPVPTTAMIHGSITSGCSSCHDTGHLWMDMSRYPISPTAVSGLSTTQYVGFQTRPVAAASTYNVADAQHPTSGDCSQCHSGTNYFSAQAEPANHIPTLSGAQCATCHTTAGNFAVYTTNLTQLHTAVATTCSTCHANGKGPFAGASGFAIVQMSTRGTHIPITNGGAPVECSGCHKTVTTFTGTIMSHSAIGDTPTAATGNACDACHEYGFSNMFYGITIRWRRDSPTHHICGAAGTPTAPNVTPCTNGGSDCLQGCHEHANQIPSQYARVKPGTPSKQIQGATTPTPAPKPSAGLLRQAIGGRTATGRMAEFLGGKVDHAALGGVACQTCHNGSAATGKAPAHPLTNNACRDCHSTMAWSPVLHVDHADVIGACATCHDGRHATGKPATHPMAGTDCDRCHTTSAWKPAAFDHKSVAPGTCATCHNGLQAPGKPATHVVTMQSCDSCHYVLGWKPVKPTAQPPTKKPAPRQAAPSRGRDNAPLAPPL